MPDKIKGTVNKQYEQGSIRGRIEALFKDNIGKVLTREQILQVSKDPKTGEEPENWHQRLSELRTDEGYTILSSRDRKDLKTGEYLMPSLEKRPEAKSRVKIDSQTWKTVLERAGNKCQWTEGTDKCELKNGDKDPIGGGTVTLTPDHVMPHSIGKTIDPKDPSQWQALCGRHQVVKKNFWDPNTGWLNVPAIVQAAPEGEKQKVYEILKDYFGD